MTTETIQQLAALNKRFYEEQGLSFNQTRQEAWPGWLRLLPLLKEYQVGLKIADIGCGNGRFCSFLFNQQISPQLEYLGLDNSSILILIAQQTQFPVNDDSSVTFQEQDIIESLLNDKPVLVGEYDLIVIFAVLQHIPSYRLREKLFSQLADHLRLEGKLVFTTWQFMDIPALKQKVVNPTQAGIDEPNLDPGDYILDWQHTAAGFRYCHYFTEAEVKQLLEASHLKIETKYLADGRSGQANCYYIVTR